MNWTSVNFVNLELFLLWHVLALPNVSKIRFIAVTRSATLVDLDMNKSRCIALLVFPEPVSPVSTIDCGSKVMFMRILLAVKKNYYFSLFDRRTIVDWKMFTRKYKKTYQSNTNAVVTHLWRHYDIFQLFDVNTTHLCHGRGLTQWALLRRMSKWKM